MNVLVIGKGGRESALAWAASRSNLVSHVYISPGNAGTLRYGENIPLNLNFPFTELVDFCVNSKIDLVLVGPEEPLVNGITDVLRKAKIPVFGPSVKAARLEGSKVFMKEFMERHRIPTARFKVFDNAKNALDYVDHSNRPFVVKTDGLAFGKGALVSNTVKETMESIHRIMVKKEFGDAGKRIVVEDILYGEEVSVFIVSDGTNFLWLASAQDHKRIYDNDEGPNTGGMGAFAPAPFINDQLRQIIENNIIIPTIDGMRKEGYPYIGVLYLGLILTASGPAVLEYNVRFGDPEAQVVLPLIQTDLIYIALSVLNGELSKVKIKYNPGYCTGVVLASKGYPDKYEKGFPITGNLKDTSDSWVFHSATRYGTNSELLTDGGRVLCVSALANTLQESIDKAYDRISQINFRNKYYRKDIGAKGIKYLNAEL